MRMLYVQLDDRFVLVTRAPSVDKSYLVSHYCCVYGSLTPYIFDSLWSRALNSLRQDEQR